MYTIENTRKALINRFNENGWNDLELTLKTGDQILISPCPADYGKKAASVNDIEYFLIYSDSVHLCGSSNIDDIAKTLNNFSELKAQDISEKEELQTFYDEHIAGHSDKEWKLGNALSSMMCNNPNYSYETPLSEVAKDLAEQLNGDAEQFEAALVLVENASTYSDWYKDVYGYRPRY